MDRPLLGIVDTVPVEEGAAGREANREAEVMHRIGDVMRSGAAELETDFGRELGRLSTMWHLAAEGSALSREARAL